MKILYDGYIYSSQFVGGINRYFTNIISGLPPDYKPSLTIVQSHNQSYPCHPNLQLFSYPRFKYRPGRISYWLEKYYFRLVSNSGYDLIHPTYYWMLTRQPMNKCSCPVVITVHDMIDEIYSGTTSSHISVIEAKRKAIVSASSIICVSNNTKKDLLNLYPISEEKISVVYHGCEINISMSYGDELIPSKPYFLYVGGRSGYKNFDYLLKVFAKILPKNSDLCLCVVGSPFNLNEIKMITDLGIGQNITLVPYSTDTYLAKLYRCSVAFIYPSLYEGFGIPILEAMNCHTPVVASESSSIPEVLGEAGLLFDPRSIDELADRLLFLLDNSSARHNFILEGQKQAEKFTWTKALDKTLSIYKSLV